MAKKLVRRSQRSLLRSSIQNRHVHIFSLTFREITAAMCALCHAARRSKSLLTSLTSCAHRGMGHPTCYAATCEAGAEIRAFSAIPQPAETPTRTYQLDPSTLNPNILKAQYAVRGELYNKAVELAEQGRDIIYTNGARSAHSRVAATGW